MFIGFGTTVDAVWCCAVAPIERVCEQAKPSIELSTSANVRSGGDRSGAALQMLHQSVRCGQPPPCAVALAPQVMQVRPCSQIQRFRPLLFRIYLSYATAFRPARKSQRLACLDRSLWGSKSNWRCSPKSRVSPVPARQRDDLPCSLRRSSLTDEIAFYCRGCNGEQRADHNMRILECVLINRVVSEPDACPLSCLLQTQSGHRLKSEKVPLTDSRVLRLPNSIGKY